MMGRIDEARRSSSTLLAADEATVDALHRIVAHGDTWSISPGARGTPSWRAVTAR